MNRKICGLVLIALLPLAACAGGARSNAHKSSNTVLLKEWEDWADQVSTSITSANFFSRYQPSDFPIVVAIGDFDNQSRRMDVGEDKDIFLNALQRKLTNSGRISTTRLYAGNAGRVDTVTRNSRELAEDTQFDAASVAGLSGKAKAAQLVLSGQFNQKKVTLDNGDSLLENYCHIELIDQVTKAVVYMDDVRLEKRR